MKLETPLYSKHLDPSHGITPKKGEGRSARKPEVENLFGVRDENSFKIAVGMCD